MQRLLWGSDWPHTGFHQGAAGEAPLTPFRNVDYGALLAWFWSVIGAEAAGQAVLAENPQRLYGFAQA